MMFRIAICDDKMQDLEVLRSGTEQWLENNVEVTGSVDAFHNPEALQDCLLKREKKFDLYVLDVMMAGIDGIQLGRMIRWSDDSVPVIYVSCN